MMRTHCLKCGHDIKKHTIDIIGNYEGLEILCHGGDEYQDCDCDAGFHKVAIKKEFTQMND